MSSPDKLIIETPEQTLLDFPLAGIGSRFMAVAADTAIQIAAVGLLLIVLAVTAPILALMKLLLGSQWAIAGLILGVFLINSGYFAFFEAVWNGQTPGKKYAKLRVIKDDGRPITVYDAITRNLVRVVDQLPAVYALGVLSIFFSQRGKRLGDHVAGTVVIHEKTLEGIRPFVETDVDPAAPAYDTGRLSADELRLIETFFSRCDSFEPSLRTSMSAQIAQLIGAKLEVQVRGWPQTENFLAAVLKQYRTTGHLRPPTEP